MKTRQRFRQKGSGGFVKFVLLCCLWTGLLLNFCQCGPSMWEWGTSYPRLKFMPLNWPKVTVSGISTGGAKALHLYLAHSNIVDGIAIFAGVQHRCGDASSGKMSGFYECFNGIRNLSHLIETAEDFQSANLIDPLTNLGHGRQYVEHGRNDEVINVRVGRQTGQFLGRFSRNVLYHESKAIHGMVFIKLAISILKIKLLKFFVV
ncbi:unnamed protein product [Allacma fusca]|uniref:Pectin acetylesterase n=1 Tax=Allacma fusca TaxID=39272 RepID=A0A8J2PY53_9HEXA|nr:unnamed protein product [Allacma fusca]